MIQILLVDDQKTVRESLKAVLISVPDFQVVGTADCSRGAIAQVGKLHPDVILMDIKFIEEPSIKPGKPI
ncbi:MAG: response regulator [Cyanobacteria bacterium P01_A01_bin.40]